MSHLMCFLLCLLLFLSVTGLIPYELVFDRSGDTIILKCRDSQSGVFERVEFNDSITFWVNRTESVQIGVTDLRVRTDLPGKTINGEKFIFGIRPELEGLYSCGLRRTNGNAISESDSKSLICKTI